MDREKLKQMENEDHLIWLEKYLEEKGYIKFWDLFNSICTKSIKYYSKKVIKLELNCPAIMNLSTRNDLNHKERTALLMIYLKMGKEGEERLWEILRQQTNFNERTSRDQIDYYKKKNKIYGISCEKLREWNICKEDFADCNKYNDKSI